MKELLSFLVSQIIGIDDFEVEENVNENGFVALIVKTDPKYIGFIIGKQGKMIRAIRTILKTKATLLHVGFSLDVVEKESK